MDYFCHTASLNETSLTWISKNCQCDWINIIMSLFSTYITSLLITSLQWMESNRDPKFTNRIFGNHCFRVCLTMVLFLVYCAEFADAFLSASPFYIFLVPIASFAVLITLAILGILTERTDHPLLLLVTGSLWAANGGTRAFRFILLCYEGVQINCLRSLTAAFSSVICFLIAFSEFFIVKYELNRKKRLREYEGSSFDVHVYRHDDVNVFSRATFYWMNSFMRCGYKSPIELSDLGTLPSCHAARQLHQRLETIISHHKGVIAPATAWKLFLIFMQPDFYIGGVFKLLGDLASIVGPLGISLVVSFVANEKTKNVPEDNLYDYPSISELWRNGWTVAFIVFFASIAQSTFSQASTHFVNVKSIHLKVALQSLIYKKSLKLRISSKGRDNSIFSKKQENEKKSNENIDFGILVNLMSNDTTNIMSFFTIAHYIWAIPIKMVAIMFLLYLQLGASAIIGAVTTIMLLLPLQFLIGRKMSRNISAISELTDKRLQLLSILTEKIELFKLLSWEKYHCDKILKVRKNELELLDKDSLFWAIITFFTHASSVLVSLITFGIHYILSDISLSSYGVFSALALFNQLMVPLFIFPVIIPIITEALVSCRRISEFFCFQETTVKRNNINSEEIQNKSKISQTCEISCKMTSIIEEDEFRLPEISNEFRLNIDDTYLEIEKHKFKDEPSLENIFKLYPEKDKVYDNSDQNLVNFIKNKSQHFGLLPEDLILVIENGEFSWNPEFLGTQLTVKNFEIPIGRIIFILGKVGSGKTSLLSAILGEMSQTNGNMRWCSNISIAYCPQTPWLSNGTIRENILFGLPFHTRRYDQVISACALKPDIDILPKKDLTEIGENGINLSGGQKQRIAIARAIYSRAKLIILDDPFSSLDLSMATSIFNNGIKSLVRRCNRSVILVTHNTGFLEECHSVILMEGGTIKAHARPNDINLLTCELQNGKSDNIKNERTINERWLLTKSVIRLKRSLNNTVGFWSTEAKGNYLKSCEWKLISHDLPLPTDEFQSNVLNSNIPLRKNSVKRKRIGRASSLQDRHIRSTKSPQIIRQYSSPLTSNTNQLFSNGKKQRSEYLNIHAKEFAMSSKQDYNYKTCVSKVVSSESGLNDTCNDFDDEILEVGEDYVNKDTEEREYGKLRSQIYVKYLKACGFKVSLAYLIITLTWQIARVYTDFWLSIWVETPVNYGVLKYLYVYASLSVGATFLSLISHGLGQLAGSLARKTLHDSMLFNIFQCSNKLLECTRSGSIFSRFSVDIEIIDKKLATTIQRLMQFLLLCCSAMVINAVITPWFMVIAIPVILLYYIIQKFYQSSSRELLRIDNSTRTPVFSHFTETLSGLSSIRAFGYEEKFLMNFYAKLNLNTNCFLILNCANRWLGIVLDYLGGIIVLLGMITALIAVKLYPNAITPSIVGLAMNYTLLVPIYLNWVVKFFADFEIYLGAVERVNHYINFSTEKHAPHPVLIDAIPSDWPKFGDIKFESVSLKYESSPEPILTEINIHIPSGQKVGICGRSGSGKSTLALSLFNMLEIHRGVIKIDDLDITKIPVNLLRTRGSIIPQDTLLFNGTVRENLDASGSFTDDQIWTAVNEAQLKEIIETNYSGNLDSEMDAGRCLSGGQKQLFSLARAILRKSSFLIMDEATSNLDKESEQILMSTAQRVFKGRTLIIIAHRLSTILDCDRIIVLEKGKIIEDGVPNFLMNISSGIFATMVRASEEGFLVP